MLGNVSPRVFNENYLMKVANGGTEKTAATSYTENFIRDRIREESFASKVLTPRKVGRADCQVSVQHDTLTKLVFMEPQTRAFSMDFRGTPKSSYIYGPRMECAFYTIASERYEKVEQELLVYDFPITKVVEDNAVKDMQEIRDRHFLVWVEAAVQATQAEANGGTVTALNRTSVAAGSVVEHSVFKSEQAISAATDNAVALPVQRPDITRLTNGLLNRRLRPHQLLLTESDFNNTMTWTMMDWGSKMQSETAVKGYQGNELLGWKFVRTIKTDILRPGNIYCFTHEDYLGRMFILTDTKFYIDKIANLVIFQAWEDIGMVLVNVASAVKMETFSGDASSVDTDGILGTVTPLAEESLGAMNNRIDAGVFFPAIEHY